VLPQASGAADLERGIRLTREGDFEAAVAALQSAVKLLSGTSASRDLARAHTYLGVAHLNMGQDAAARADFQAALKADPKLTLSSSEFPPKVTQAFAAARTAAGLPAATGPSIDHAPLKCLVEDLFPEVRAGVQSPASVQKSRVYFKAHQFPDWYYVEMETQQVPNYLGVLPKPLPGTAKVDYYVYALDGQLQTTQTAEYDPAVEKACRRDPAAAALQKDPRITLYGTREGQLPIPPGFDKAGIVAFVTVAGATVAGAALAGGSSTAAGAAASSAGSAGTAGGGGSAAGGSGAASGGGMSAGKIGLIVGGLAAAGLGVAAAAGGGGDEDPLATDNDGDGLSENAGDCNDADGQVNPNGVVNFANARFETTTSTCGEGSDEAPVSLVLLADAANNRCGTPLTINGASVVLTIEIANGTNNRPGQRFNIPSLAVSPTTVAAGSRATIRLDPRLVCTNAPGEGGGAFNEFSAQLTVNTSAGTFTLQATNRHRVSFPFRIGGMR
jgi:hypothetical protein